MPVVSVPQQLANLPRAVRQVNAARSVIVALPAGPNYLQVSASRNSWPNTGKDVVKLTFEISGDNGATWQFLAGITAPGGEARGAKGKLMRQSALETNYDAEPGMWLRVTETVLADGLDLATSASYTTVPVMTETGVPDAVA